MGQHQLSGEDDESRKPHCVCVVGVGMGRGSEALSCREKTRPATGGFKSFEMFILPD